MIPAGVRIFVCTEPVDMRRSFDGLALAAREKLGCDPQQGGIFVFANKRSNRLKLLWFDRNGYCILYRGCTAPYSGCPRVKTLPLQSVGQSSRRSSKAPRSDPVDVISARQRYNRQQYPVT